jgi:hypothetical protein
MAWSDKGTKSDGRPKAPGRGTPRRLLNTGPSNIDDGQSGRIVAQDITKSTATMQGCMNRDSGMEQLPTM